MGRESSKARYLRYLLRTKVLPSKGRTVRKGGSLFGHFHLQEILGKKEYKQNIYITEYKVGRVLRLQR